MSDTSYWFQKRIKIKFSSKRFSSYIALPHRTSTIQLWEGQKKISSGELIMFLHFAICTLLALCLGCEGTKHHLRAAAGIERAAFRASDNGTRASNSTQSKSEMEEDHLVDDAKMARVRKLLSLSRLGRYTPRAAMGHACLWHRCTNGSCCKKYSCWWGFTGQGYCQKFWASSFMKSILIRDIRV